MWRPKLVLRFSKHGRIASPTTTGGVLATTAYAILILSTIAVLLARASNLGGWEAVVAFAVGGFLGVRVTRDAWAWFAASPAEREAFRGRVAEARLEGRFRRAPVPRTRSDWSIGYLLALAALTAASLLLVRVHIGFLLAAMLSLALLVLVLLDRLRGRRDQK